MSGYAVFTWLWSSHWTSRLHIRPSTMACKYRAGENSSSLMNLTSSGAGESCQLDLRSNSPRPPLSTLFPGSSLHACWANACTPVGKATALGSLLGWHPPTPAPRGPRMWVKDQCTSLWPSQGLLLRPQSQVLRVLSVLWIEGARSQEPHTHTHTL